MRIFYNDTNLAGLKCKVLFSMDSGHFFACELQEGANGADDRWVSVYGPSASDGIMFHSVPFSQTLCFHCGEEVVVKCRDRDERLQKPFSLQDKKRMMDFILQSLEAFPSKWGTWWYVFNDKDLNEIREFFKPLVTDIPYDYDFGKAWDERMDGFSFLKDHVANKRRLVRMKCDCFEFKKGHFYISCGEAENVKFLINEKGIATPVPSKNIE